MAGQIFEVTKETVADHLPGGRLEPGVFIYRCTKPDYGCANDDTRILGKEHMSMTLDPDGDYPFFTVPVENMQAIEPA